MSDVASETEFAAPERPSLPPRRDPTLPILLGASLLVHATVFLPSFLRSEAPPDPKKEIPVEVVQLPPPQKPPGPKPPEPKPVPRPPVEKAERQTPPKTAEAKPKPPAKATKPAEKSVAERMKDLLGPMPAIVMPASTADGGDEVSYSQLVLSKLAKAKKEGRYEGIPAATSVSFTLGDAGNVAHVEIVRPSGDPSLDAEAIAMVKRGAPYPPPPPGGRRDYTITLRFQAVT